jgi:glycine oxidase
MSASRDVVVVGAGVVGCAVACELARRGAAVEIVDERLAGMGATQASAGILAPFIEARERSPFLDLTVRSLELFDDFVARAAAESGQSVLYRRTGTLDVATHEARLDELRLVAAALESRGVRADLIDGPSARRQEPNLSDGVTGALLIPSHGFVAPGELTRALAMAARRHGAQLVEGSKVKGISTRDGDLVVKTERGPLTCDTVVLAAGSWSGCIDIEGLPSRVPVRPVRGQLLHLAWSGAPLRRVTWASHCYLVPWEDGTLLVGATVEEVGFDERTTVAGVRGLLEGVSEIVPQAASAGFISARAGLRPAAPDQLPIVGRSAAMPSLVYATAHYRNGVLLAPLTAVLVADLMLDDRIDPALHAIGPQRFGGL